jgi:hypothetical protein
MKLKLRMLLTSRLAKRARNDRRQLYNSDNEAN